MISVTVLVVIAESSLQVLRVRANINKSAWCLRACGLDKDRTLSERVQVLKSLSCYHCVKRRRDIGGLVLTGETNTERRKRSFATDDCANTADEGTPLPEQQFTSRPDVIFGQYKNTAGWYANVSWNPVKDPEGVLKGYLVHLQLFSHPSVLCSVVPKNKTYLSINITRYGYTYSDPIYLLIQSKPSNVSDHMMLRFANDVRIPTSKSPQTSTAAKVPTRETTNEVSNKTIKYVSIFVGLAVGILLVIAAVVVLRKFLSWRRKRDQGFGDETFIISDNKDSD